MSLGTHLPLILRLSGDVVHLRTFYQLPGPGPEPVSVPVPRMREHASQPSTRDH